MEETNIQIGGGRRLVLGFDAGCMTCSELAKKIEEVVGDKLEVIDLRHPQVEQWREQALGKDAPWAPTLIEVEEDKAKAWTGLRLGVALSRRLGPASTWRVMQALGETTSATEPSKASISNSSEAANGGVGRGQFLKVLGGVAAAIPVLSAGGIASAAGAQTVTSGTQAQRRQIWSMILDSEQHKSLARKLDKPLDFSSARFDISEEQSLASVGARTKSSTGLTAVVLFFVDLRAGGVQYSRYVTLTPKGDGSRAVADASEVDIVAYENGRVIDSVSFNDGAVVTSDGQKLSVEKFLTEAKERQKSSNLTQERGAPISSRGCRPGYDACERNRFRFCFFSTSGLCFFIRYFGAWGAIGQIACWLYPDKRSGCRSIAVTSCYRDYC